jgi:hypothetical protein
MWVSPNKLTINVDKTCFTVFRPTLSSCDLSQFSLVPNTKIIDRVSSVKCLGIVIDENLTWSNHIESLCQFLPKHIVFYKLRFFIPLNILRILYFSLVHSKILYGVEIYANNFQSRLHDLEILNNRLFKDSPRKKLECLHKRSLLQFQHASYEQIISIQIIESCSCPI